jgi:hypothetical protein
MSPGICTSVQGTEDCIDWKLNFSTLRNPVLGCHFHGARPGHGAAGARHYIRRGRSRSESAIVGIES